MLNTNLASVRRAKESVPVLSAATERRHIERFHTDQSPEALAALIESHLRLVVSIARRYATRTVSLEDLTSEGVVGLCEAAHRFDLARSSRFSTYARWWVRARIREFALKNRRLVGPPNTRNGRRTMGRWNAASRRLTAALGRPPTNAELAEEIGVHRKDVEQVRATFDGYDAPMATWGAETASGGSSPEEELARTELSALMHQRLLVALKVLDVRELEIIRRRHLQSQPVPLRVLGEELGLSRERVRQLEVRAKRKLRAVLADPRTEAN